MKFRHFIALFLFGTGFFLPTISPAQGTTFGKNKVQYRTFEWYFIQSSHFDIYFDKGSENLADFTAIAAESAYSSISSLFRFRINQRIPLIIYNSHNTFQQTNVVSSFLEEGIGGVTELFKNRVVVPFEGEYKKFRHVLHHELVHAVINDMFYGGSIQSIITNNITLQLPLWFNEGLAEYAALKWDTNSDMFLRDATLHEYLPPIEQLGGYFAYRGGQSVWNYIADKYGEGEIGEILTRIRGTRNVDLGFKGAIGLTVEELSEKWLKEQKVLYWPDVAKREEPIDYSRALTDHRKDGGFYNTSPSISPRGDRVAFISNRDDFFDVFVMNASDGEVEEKLIDGQRTADFEELHLLTPGMTWSPDSRKIAVAVKSGDRDAIIVKDVEEGDEEKLEFELDGIFSVDWSRTIPQRLAFMGVKEGQSDIYVFDLESKTLTNLTNDIFSDTDPVWSPDGSTVYFSSDRKNTLDGRDVPPNFKIAEYNADQLDLYSINTSTRAITRITNLPTSDETSPVVMPDGSHILFISDMNGINNIYLMDMKSGTSRPLTNSISGVYQLSLSGDGERLAFSSLNNAGFDLFLMRTPVERDLHIAELEKTEFFKEHRDAAVAIAQEQKEDTIRISDGVVMKRSTENSTRRESEATINLQNFVFRRGPTDSLSAHRDSSRFPEVANNIDENGNYRVSKYKLNFSPDIIYGNAGYSTFYGVQGSTVLAFSDMLGDHQIYLMTNLLLDLKNSDYSLAYLYLPKRIDYGIQGFHSVRLALLREPVTGETLNRFRNYGVNLFALYPINKFERFDFGLSWYNVSRENLDIPEMATDRVTGLLPSVGYVLDNSLWGMIAPAIGRRFSMTLMISPKFGGESPGFYSVLTDYRHYFRLGTNYTLAFRLAGGGSFGDDPQRFIVGGVDNWIAPRYAHNSFPIADADDYLFLTSGVPLRGYDYNQMSGTKYGLFNMEIRFPLFGYLVAGPLPILFQTFNGVLFLDAGTAWYREKDVKLFTRRPDNSVVSNDLLTGMGFGVRTVFIGFLLKMDIAWAFNYNRFSDPRYYFSVGTDL